MTGPANLDTGLSQDFMLAEPRNYDLQGDDPQKWKAVPYDKKHESATIKIIEDAWIYVFRQSLAPTTPKLYRVIYAKKGSTIYPVWENGDEVKEDPRIVTGSGTARSYAFKQSFPDRLRTDQYFYFFYVFFSAFPTSDVSINP